MNMPVRDRARPVSLSDALDLDASSAYLNANQALVRLLLMQSDADRAAGLRTAGFVSGYRGSPLGGIDQALWLSLIHISEPTRH